MKNTARIIGILLLIFISNYSFSQGASCAAPDPFCTGVVTTFPAGTNVPDASTTDPGNNYGCLGSQPNPAWYFLKIATPGALTIDLTNSANVDVDFALWGPFPNLSNATNSCGTLGSPSDCSFSTAPNETANITGASVGNIYVLLVTNFSNTPTNISFTNTAGTAATDCAIINPCIISNLSVNPTACNPSTNTYDVSGSITFTDPPSTGSLTLNDCNGNSQTFGAPFTSPLNYSFTGIAANGSACDITAAFSDDINCAVTTNFTAPAPCPPTPGCSVSASTVVTDISCNGLSDGQIIASMTGSTAPTFTYTWDATTGNQTSSTASGLNAGFYSATITDGNGCSAITSGTINEPPILNITLTKVNPLCNGGTNGSATATVSGGTPPYNYLWNDNANQTTATTVGIGADTLTVIVTDAGNCTITDNIKILAPIATTLTPSITNANCGQADGGACIIAAGGAGGHTYLWNDPLATTLSCLINVISGPYAVSVSDVNNCITVKNIVIPDLAGISVAVTDSVNVSCFGGSDGQATAVMIGGTGNSPTYAWQGGSNTPTAFNLSAGVYSIQITDSIGCTASALVTILEPTILFSSPTFTNPTCFGFSNGTAQPNTTGGTSPYNYSWNNPPSITTSIASNLIAGNYNLDITDANGCITSESFTLIDPPLLNASIASTNVSCFGSSDGTAITTTISGVSPFIYNWTNTSQATSAINNLAANTYDVTITDPAGCNITRSTTITSPIQLNVSVTNFSNISCNGTCDGFIQLSVTGGTSPYLFNWNNGSTNQDLNLLCANTYSLTITDANGCSTTLTKLLTEPIALSASINRQNISCFSLCDGSTTINPNGGTLPYNIQWGANTGFQTGNTANNLCANNINVTVTDAQSCVLTQTTFVSEPTQLKAVIDTSSSNCGQNNGTISISSTLGGKTPYTYQWNDPLGNQTPILNNITAGCYRVILKDANNCIIDSTICINDIEGPKITLFNSTDVTCFNNCDGQINLNVATPISNTFPPSIDWSVSCGGATTTPLPLFKDGLAAFLLCACDYSAVATDTAGCIGTFTHTISEPKELVSLIANPTNVSCFGGSNGIAPGFAVLGTPPYTFDWIPTGQTTITATGLVPGNHCLVTTDSKGCDDTTCVIITEPIELSALSTTRNATCNGACDGSISLNTSGGKPGYNYFWDNSLPNQATVGNLCAGVYTVTIFDSNGCFTITSSTISEPLPLTATTSSISSVCTKANGTANVSGTSGGIPPYLYQWNTSPIQNTSTAINLLWGSYNVIITDQNGCSLPLSTSVSDQPGPVITNVTTTNPSCAGTATGTAHVEFTNGTPNFLFSWDDLLVQPNQTANNLLAGIYHITVTDANGCTDVETAIINQPNPLIAIPIGSKTICYGDSVTIWGAAQGGTPFNPGSSYSITWTNDSTLTGQGPHIVFPLTTTDYTYSIEDSKGCTASAGVSVVVRPPLQVSVPTEETICLGSSASLSATGFGGTATSNWCFHWTGGNIAGTDPEITDCGMNTDNQTVNPVDTTTYRVILTDACSLPDTAFITVNVLPLPVPVFVPVKPEGCPPFDAIFSGNSNMDTVNICWDFDADGINDTCEIIDNAGDHSIQNWTYATSGFHDIILSVESQDGCSFAKPFLQAVHVFPAPIASFTAAPKVVKLINSLVSFNATETLNATDISWDFGDGNGGVEYVMQNQYESIDTFIVKLTAFNNFGCLDTARDTIIVQPDHAMYTPNAFTPNGDGHNDFFFPVGIGISDSNFKFSIFDRWGKLIFISTDRQIKWDGRKTGNTSVAPTGVYIWRLQAFDLNGNVIDDTKRIGQVTLLR